MELARTEVRLGKTTDLTEKVPSCDNALCHIVNAALWDLSSLDCGREICAKVGSAGVERDVAWHGHVKTVVCRGYCFVSS